MTGYQTGTGNQLTNDGLWTYTYDSEGNLIKKSKGSSLETWQFGYDNLNHLIWAKDEPTDGGSPTLIATYIYDVFGNRIEKDVWTSAGGTVISRFGYDLAEPPASAGGLANAWADLNGSNQLMTRYLAGDQAGPPLARISAAGVVGWYLADQLGSVRNLTDNSGTLIDTIAYDAYGKVTNETSPSNGDRYKWATLQFDNETGLYHAWARDELPPVGRWMQQDPSGFGAGDNNLYRYSFNDPSNRIDQSGLAPKDFPINCITLKPCYYLPRIKPFNHLRKCEMERDRKIGIAMLLLALCEARARGLPPPERTKALQACKKEYIQALRKANDEFFDCLTKPGT